MLQKKGRSLLFFFFFLMVSLSILFAHSKDVSYMVLNIDEISIDGQLFLHGYEVARLAQQFNLDLSEISPEMLKNLLRSYFNIHFQIEGKKGFIEKSIIDFRNSDPSEFLATGISLIFYVKLDKESFPLVFSSDIFFEFSTTQTNKLVFLDKLDRPLPDSREVLLTPRLKDFTFDLAKPDFRVYDFSLRDSDRDGISDRYEALYGLDSEKPDTDGDGFTDFEEFFAGWDPFDPTLSPDQSKLKYREAIQAFAELYRQKPTEESLLLSLPEESALKEDENMSVSATVANVMERQHLHPGDGTDNGFLQQLLGKMEAELFYRFDFGQFLFLLLLTAGLGFFQAGSAGPGKGILIAYCLKDDREIRPAFFFSLAFVLSHLVVTVVEAVLLLNIFQEDDGLLSTLPYFVQIGAGAVLSAVSVILIVRSVRKIKAKIVIGKKTFFDGVGGAVMLGGITGLGASPFLFGILRMLVEVERAGLTPFFFISFGIGVFVCVILVALAAVVVRRIFLDIVPRLILYSELVSASLMLLFSLFFFFGEIPF